MPSLFSLVPCYVFFVFRFRVLKIVTEIKTKKNKRRDQRLRQSNVGWGKGDTSSVIFVLLLVTAVPDIPSN